MLPSGTVLLPRCFAATFIANIRLLMTTPAPNAFAVFRVGLNEAEINLSYGAISLSEIIVDGTSVSTQMIDIEKTARQ